jgi:hypothetical protein
MCCMIRISSNCICEKAYRQRREIRMKMRLSVTLALVAMILGFSPTTKRGTAGEAASLLATIKAVDREGRGNVEAGRAWQELVRLGPAVLPMVLAAFDDADATAANWLRAAVDAIAERALAAKQRLPAAELERFIAQQQHHGAARRLAYEWLARVDTTAPGRLLPGMLNDPSPELRRDAVECVIRDARQMVDRGDKAGATAAYRKALSGARDRDQVDQIAKDLKALGVEVDLAAHFGFIRQWLLLGPFDSSGGAGFQKDFPPEHGIDLAATYSGKKGTPIRWTASTTSDAYGIVDLNKAVGKHMGAAAYAFAVVISPTEQPVQVRAGSQNAIKIFLNGTQIFFREEYHHGMQMDQHVGTGKLRAGRNELLIKVCQNEQTDDWAQNWSFQVRICDPSGGTLPLAVSAEKPGS